MIWACYESEEATTLKYEEDDCSTVMKKDIYGANEG